jgi:uncharacterized delta-60 repeat protein
MSDDPSNDSGAAEEPSHLAPGFLVGGGRYTLLRQIARGGMGVVWLAHDERLNESVALKFLSSAVRNDAVELARLRQETQRSRKLTHTNIIRIYDLYEAPGEPAFISMEYVNGPNLWERMTQLPNRVFVWAELKPLVKQLCDALAYAHGERVIHRDLKPTNLMLAENQRLKLADFGLAAVAPQSAPATVERRFGGGTLTHMSPQQLEGEAAAVTDDIYSLGATLYDLLCGRPPFSEGNIAHQLRHDAPPPLQERLAARGLENEVPSEVAAMIMACLAKDPAKRPQSVLAVAEWIGLADAETSSVPHVAATVFSTPKVSLPEDKPPRSAAWLWLAAAGVLACAGLLFWFKHSTPAPTNTIAVGPSNGLGIATSAVVAVSVPVANDPYLLAVLALHPLAFWRLDETNGFTAYDTIHGYDGAYTNVILGQPGHVSTEPGKTGPSKLAAQFGLANGTPSIVSIPKLDLSVPNGGNGKFAVALWLRAGAVSKRGDAIISKGYAGGGEQFCLDCGGTGGAFRFYFRDSGGSSCWTTSSVKPDDKWHFLAGVCDQANSRIYIYVDGTNTGESSTTVGTGIRATSLPAIIGACQTRQGPSYVSQFAGSIDDVAIFTNVLNAAQVLALYNASPKAPASPLWPIPSPQNVSAPKLPFVPDPTFETGRGADGEITDLALLPGGEILVAGHFNTFDGVARCGLAKLRSNGGLDYLRADVDGPVNAVAVERDGRIVIAGDFNMVSGLKRPRLARLLANLALDQSLDAGDGPDKEVYCAVLANNDIFIGGAFQHIGEVRHSCVARLEANGQIDPTFKLGHGADGNVLAAAAQPDGKMLIGGSFTRYHNSNRAYLSRIHLDGAVQNIFHSEVSGIVHAIVLQADGKIIIGGEFDTVHNARFKGIARLNANGSLDAAFNPGSGADRAVLTIALQSDDKIVIGGDFRAINGVPRDHLARLNPDGSLDGTFALKVDGDRVRKVLVQPDGKILVASQFTSVEGASRAKLVRLQPQPSTRP